MEIKATQIHQLSTVCESQKKNTQGDESNE